MGTESVLTPLKAKNLVPIYRSSIGRDERRYRTTSPPGRRLVRVTRRVTFIICISE
jgi:hypothetical protein